MKLGLMLGGGGAFGAYQIGVLAALYERKILSKIKLMSGTSIGALNIVMLMGDLNSDEIEKIWSQMTNKIIYEKDKIVLFKNRRKSIVDILPLYKIITKYSTIEKVKNSKIKGFATLTEINDNKVIKQMSSMFGKKKVFCLNEVKDPFKVALGSTSVPMLFGSTTIDGKYYVDGGLTDNNPIDPLLEAGADFIIACPLATDLDLSDYSEMDINVISLRNDELFSRFEVLNHIKAMNFDPVKTKSLYQIGYQDAEILFKELEERKLLVNDKLIYQKGFHVYYLDGDGKLCIKTK